jgi:hypothetical protein
VSRQVERLLQVTPGIGEVALVDQDERVVIAQMSFSLMVLGVLDQCKPFEIDDLGTRITCLIQDRRELEEGHAEEYGIIDLPGQRHRFGS